MKIPSLGGAFHHPVHPHPDLGNPPFLHVVRALEEAFCCGFTRKEWHEVRGPRCWTASSPPRCWTASSPPDSGPSFTIHNTQGTPDGRPTPFHLELSAPEAGHVTPRIRQMQLQAGLAITPDGQVRTNAGFIHPGTRNRRQPNLPCNAVPNNIHTHTHTCTHIHTHTHTCI